jgi:ribose/xylose/arabinose/galactoside ABC-type transport system permease subunit
MGLAPSQRAVYHGCGLEGDGAFPHIAAEPTMTKPSPLFVLKRYGVLVGFLLVFIVLSLSSRAFLTAPNLANILRQAAVPGIMAVGMTFVILTAGIDLSVGSMLALAGLLCAALDRAGCPILLAVPATLLCGCLMGLANGLTITWGRVTPFVVTLGTMSIGRGMAYIVTGGEPISQFSEGLNWIGGGSMLGLPAPVVILLLTVLAGAAVLRRTRLGRYTYAIGGNVQAARLSGINVGLYTTLAYMACGLTTAIAAVVSISRQGAAESISGIGYELDVIAAVVIGGTSLAGGKGGVWGTLLGALLIGTINNGVDLLHVSSYYQSVVKGAIIIAAVLLDRLRQE